MRAFRVNRDTVDERLPRPRRKSAPRAPSADCPKGENRSRSATTQRVVIATRSRRLTPRCAKRPHMATCSPSRAGPARGARRRS